MRQFNPDALITERGRRGFTQKELADKSGLSDNIISKYERGLVQPRAASSFRIANALMIDREILYLETSEEAA